MRVKTYRTPADFDRALAEYNASLKAMSDEALFEECKSKIWLSAYAANNPRSDYHWQCDRCYGESSSRDNKAAVYTRAYNAVTQQVAGR